jgi:phage terminase small subunit
MSNTNKNTKQLKPQHKVFASYYAKIGSRSMGNATQSAIKAGYSKKSAGEIACRLLQRDDVKREVERVQGLNAQLINIDPKFIENECLLCYEQAQASGDWVSARAFLDILAKCVGAYKSDKVELSIQALEPTEPEARKKWLEQELGLLQQQAEAGTGLPQLGDVLEAEGSEPELS